jgi:hypothetical protein
MKKLLIVLSVMFLFSLPAVAQDPSPGCVAIYYVPIGQPYNERAVRPPFWTVNRWECLAEGVTSTPFVNSPATGTDVNFQLALIFDNGSGAVYYPVLYVNEQQLGIYDDGDIIPPALYSVDQGTGQVTRADPPVLGAAVTFDIGQIESRFISPIYPLGKPSSR